MIDPGHISLPPDFSPEASSRLLARTALARGLRVAVIEKNIFLIEGNGRAEYFEWTMAASTSRLAQLACKSKPLAKRFFRQGGVPTPRGLVFTRREIARAVEFMRSAGGRAFVLKPTDGAHGDMVFMNIDGAQALRARCARFKKHRPLLLEEQAQGTECRYFVLADRVIAVAERRPAHVLGDGESTVAQLIARKNAGRRDHPALTAIEVDAETMVLLSEQGANLETVPRRAQAVRLKRVPNISQGGDSIDRTDLAHPDLKALAVAALRAIPTLIWAGIDVIAEDHAAPLPGQRAVALEINSYPMLSLHHAPAEGTPRDVAGAIIEHLFFG